MYRDYLKLDESFHPWGQVLFIDATMHFDAVCHNSGHDEFSFPALTWMRERIALSKIYQRSGLTAVQASKRAAIVDKLAQKISMAGKAESTVPASLISRARSMESSVPKPELMTA